MRTTTFTFMERRGETRCGSGKLRRDVASIASSSSSMMLLLALAACGDVAQTQETRPTVQGKAMLAAPDPLPPGGRFAKAEHAVGQAAVFVEAGDLLAATEALDSALLLDPMNRQALFVRGRIRLAEQRAGDALSCFEEAREMREDVSVYEWIGLAYLALRDESLAGEQRADGEPGPKDHAESARVAFEQVLRIDPLNGNARHNLGYCNRLAGRLDLSVAILQSLVAEQPERARTLYELGVSLRAAGRPEEAREIFRRLLGIQPEHGSAQLALQELGG